MIKKEIIATEFNFLFYILNHLHHNQKQKNNCLYELDLTGSRLSGKTISLMVFVVLCMFKLKNCKIVFTRYEPQGAQESFEELIGVATMLNVYDKQQFNLSKKRWRYKSNEVRFIGFKSNTKKSKPKLGLARGVKRDILIWIVDETTEFSNPTELELINQALGGANQYVKIRASNPWVLSHFFISEVNAYLPYNKKIMKKKGANIKSEWITSNYFKLNSQTNHRTNQFLSDIQHKQLTNLWNIDPHIAQVADLGIPGVVRGSIFAKLMNKIRDSKIIRQHNRTIYECGLDWGESDMVGGSGVAFVGGRRCINNQWETFDFEYSHRNSTSILVKDQQTLIKEVVASYVKGVRNNWNLTNIKRCGNIEIKVDNAAFGIGNLFKAELKQQDQELESITIIKHCKKHRRHIRARVRKYQMGSNQLFINKALCPTLWEQWEQAIYDENKLPDEEVWIKDNDDMIDAADYKSDKATINITKNKIYNTIYK